MSNLSDRPQCQNFGKNTKEASKRRAENLRSIYYEDPKYCQKCKALIHYEKRHNKFCCQSCAATVNNTGVRRHGSEPNRCKKCGQNTKTKDQIFCSTECFTLYRNNNAKDPNYKKKMNAQRQSKYRTKKYRTLAGDADGEKIKEIYLNCPEGYEVDHIIPVSKP